MAYNIIDILDKTIHMAEKRKQLYLNIDYMGQDKQKFQLIQSVLIRSIEREIKYYEDIIHDLKDMNLEIIDFRIYDKISFLMNQFNNKIYYEKIDNIPKLIKWTAALHKDIFALFMSIQGKLVTSESDFETFAYKILSNVLIRKEKTIKELERLL
ncbi:hypothetical protein [Oceanirhabdus sp. W0125-5]|uniref:hypothetical protein n=1 Tax=Oceanirhabdus sp. W0125-5 TaxID=2999116 RepID=UPI0022F2C39E|nr:hypothetical protein [Oceanirhabdus sp. W0125-5]WBW97155.1 hypothetical protein OW730_26220 [Oceanirhabdus sp. W0125-5]